MDCLSRAISTAFKCIAAAMFTALAPTVAHAALVNGNFESGDTSGWNVYWDGDSTAPLAYVAVIGASSLFPPLTGNYSALITSVSTFQTGVIGNTSCAMDRFNPHYCPPYPPTGVPSAPVGGPPVTNQIPIGLPGPNHGVGYVAQDFTGLAGQSLEWDWRLDTLADPPDYMFAALTNGSYFILYQSREQGASLFEGIRPPSGPTQWLQQLFGLDPIDFGELRHQGFTLPSDGLWTVYFGVSQLADTWFSAAIQLDNVELYTVDAPGTFALAVLGLGLLLATSARLRAMDGSGRSKSAEIGV